MFEKQDFADLIGVPYKRRGRGADGLDCYGLAIECARRNGRILPDVFYEGNEAALMDENLPTLPLEKCGEGDSDFVAIVEKDRLHIGVMMKGGVFVHATENQGVRISKVAAFPRKEFYKWRE